MIKAAWRRRGPRHFKKYGRTLFLLAWASMAGFGLFLFGNVVSMEVDRLLEDQQRPQDYMAFYAAAKLVSEGRGDEIYDLDAISEVQSDLLATPAQGVQTLPYLNPPFVAVLLVPLTVLSIGVFSGFLFGLNVALVVVGGVGLQKLVAPREGRHTVFLWVAYVSAPTVFGVFLHLQLSMLVLLAWLGFIHFQLRGKEGWAGAALALG